MSADEPNIINVFFSYAHEDEKLKIELEKQLSFLKRQGLISGWNDRDIKAGQEWAYEIDKNLDIARIILLLISPDFIASDYCYSNEMTRAMERHGKGEALVIPIILRPVYWHDAPFSKLQALPTDGKPVKSWSDVDEALLDIAKGIRSIVVGILKEKWLKEGESSYKTRNFKAAFAAFEKAIELVPDCAEAYYGEGKVYLYRPYTEPETDVSDYELAIAAFDKAIELEPLYVSAYFQLGMVHQVEQEYQKALAAFDKAIELKPAFAPAYCQKGIIYRDRPPADEIDYELAVAAFDKAIELEPLYVNAYYQLGIVLYKMHNFTRALSAFQKADKLKPNNPSYHEKIADTLYQLNKYTSALHYYERAIERNANNGNYYVGKGNALLKLKRFEEALKAFNDAIEIEPSSSDAYTGRGNTYKSLAEQSLKMAKELGKGQPN